jgi:DtxR family Mn-dependent transcriptional regulator
MKTAKKVELSQTMEDYLETIFKIQQIRRAVRVKDIAKLKGVSLPSVNSALSTLKKKKLVIHNKYDYVELSELGEEVARKIDTKHRILREFFTNILGLDEELSELDACRMEHGLSSTTLERLVSFMEYLYNCPYNQGITKSQLTCFKDSFLEKKKKKAGAKAPAKAPRKPRR